MYIIKVKGKNRIADFIQIRDDKFTLVAYFRADRPLTALKKHGLMEWENEIIETIREIPYGKIKKMEI